MSAQAGAARARAAARVLALAAVLAGAAAGACRGTAVLVDAPGRRCDPARVALRLPFGPGAEHGVLQGPFGAGGHVGDGAWAWDFAMPVGTPVLAAAAGIVVEVTDGFTEGRPDPALADRANLVIVDHGDNCFGVYQHLSPGTMRVREGDTVAAGAVLAEVGLTGNTTEPHLHFALVDERHRSVPARFDDVPGGRPVAGLAYRAPTTTTAGGAPAPRGASFLPSDTFADNGVVLTSGIPSHRLERGAPIQVLGRAAPGAIVVAFFLPRSGGRPLAQVAAPVSRDGAFTLALEAPDGVERVGFAIALASADGAFRSRFAVPLVVRDPVRAGR